MGLVSSAFGIALVRPDAAPGIIAALVVFTMHHLILKGTLFLGVGEWQRNGGKPWLITVFAILALAMAGVPFTSGASAKSMMSEALIDTGIDLALLLGFSTTGTLLLLARFIWLIMQRPAAATAGFDWASLNWTTLAMLAVLLPLLGTAASWSASGLGVIATAISIAVAISLRRRMKFFRLPSVPPGDLLYLWRASQRLRSGQIDLHDLTLAPRKLLLADEVPTAVRTVGALIWLLAFVVIASFVMLPG
jgi:formate hydrogenlyase subunit 3/multisubunit Na+/H+ antiporter MnhD subunit